MKNKIILIFISLVSLVGLTSCENDWLDVNKNPNTATKVDAPYLFGYAITSWSGNRTGGDCFWPIGMMGQVFSTGGNFGWGYAEDRYDISPYSTGNTWKLYYATAGANLKDAIRLAEEDKKPNYAAQSKIVLSALVYECSMIWGDIPFSEAWKGIDAPKFDTQKDVLDGVLALLDEALAQIEVDNKFTIKTEDLYYGGDMQKWIAFANSLKLKVAMVMVDKDTSKATLIKELLSKPLITESMLNVEFPYYNEAGHKNPKYRLFEKYNGGKNSWFFANDTILDGMMKPLNDPRIPIFYALGEKGKEYKGVTTATEADDTYSLVKVGLYPDAPDLILSSQEINFLIAEAYLRGLGVAESKADAQKYFRKGLKQSLEYYKVDASEIETFLNKEEFILTQVSNPLRTLRVQQYVDLVDRPLEAWVQQRRSGKKGAEIPNLKTPEGAPVPAGEIARRWSYPNDELTGNENAPKELPHLWDNMWFDE